MLPDLSVLIAILLGLWQIDGPAPADPARALLGTACCLLIGGAMSRMAFGRALRALEEDDELVAQVQTRWITLWPVLGWIAATTWFLWGAWVGQAVPRTLWMTRYVVLFLPLFAVLAVGWAARAQIEGELIRRRGGISPLRGPRDGIRRGFRKNSVILIPLFLIYAISEGIWLGGELGVGPLRTFSLWSEVSGLVNIGIMIVLMLLALPFIPRIFARALNARPLAPGRLRDVLERAASEIDLRYKDIMVWRTGGRVFNAMVVGFTPGTRMIFLTDGLISALPEDETLAVFFHEAGHAKKHHLPLFILLFFSFSLLFYAASGPLEALGLSPYVILALHLAALWFFILGYVSRRFERESDVFGAEHASVLDPDAPPILLPGLPAPLPRGAALMARALERIRTIVGHGGSHRHGSVEDRIAYVAHHAIDPGTRLAFERSMRGLKLLIGAMLAVAVAVTALRMPTEVAHAESHVQASDAERRYEEAWAAEHARDPAVVATAPALWRDAYEGFVGAVERLAAAEDLVSRRLRARGAWNAGDTALHGLRDREAAARWFARALSEIEDLDEQEPPWALLRFQAHVELGRLAAWDAAEHPGEHGPDLAVTLGHREKARALRSGPLRQEARATQRLLDERLRLLEATYDAARGAHAEARHALAQLVQLGDAADPQPTPLQEIADDAARELERLPPAGD